MSKFIKILLIIGLLAAAGYWAYEQYGQSARDNVSPLPKNPAEENQTEVCIQVITPARNAKTGEVQDFPTPCDVPEGWIKIESKPEEKPISDMRGIATYTSSKYDYRVEYPANWQAEPQMDGAFLNLSTGPRAEDWLMEIDLACVFAVGFEDPSQGTPTFEQTTVKYGDNTFTEHKTYVERGGKKELAIHNFTIPFPLWYAATHSFNDKPDYYKDHCKEVTFVLRNPFHEEVLRQILTSFKFTQ